MKKVTLILMFGLSQSIVAEDFRGLSFGDSCTDIDSYELSVGSTRHVSKVYSKNVTSRIYTTTQLYEKGIALFGASKIEYICDDQGIFKRGRIFHKIDFEKKSEIPDVIAAINDMYGIPTLIERPLEKEKVIPISLVWRSSVF